MLLGSSSLDTNTIRSCIRVVVKVDTERRTPLEIGRIALVIPTPSGLLRHLRACWNCANGCFRSSSTLFTCTWIAYQTVQLVLSAQLTCVWQIVECQMSGYSNATTVAA